MSKFANNMQVAFERTLRCSFRIHNRALFLALILLGIVLLASVVSAQKLTTPSSTGQNTHSAPQSVLTATASRPAQQEQMPQEPPSSSTPEQAPGYLKRVVPVASALVG